MKHLKVYEDYNNSSNGETEELSNLTLKILSELNDIKHEDIYSNEDRYESYDNNYTLELDMSIDGIHFYVHNFFGVYKAEDGGEVKDIDSRKSTTINDALDLYHSNDFNKKELEGLFSLLNKYKNNDKVTVDCSDECNDLEAFIEQYLEQ